MFGILNRPITDQTQNLLNLIGSSKNQWTSSTRFGCILEINTWICMYVTYHGGYILMMAPWSIPSGLLLMLENRTFWRWRDMLSCGPSSGNITAQSDTYRLYCRQLESTLTVRVLELSARQTYQMHDTSQDLCEDKWQFTRFLGRHNLQKCLWVWSSIHFPSKSVLDQPYPPYATVLQWLHW